MSQIPPATQRRDSSKVDPATAFDVPKLGETFGFWSWVENIKKKQCLIIDWCYKSINTPWNLSRLYEPKHETSLEQCGKKTMTPTIMVYWEQIYMVSCGLHVKFPSEFPSAPIRDEIKTTQMSREKAWVPGYRCGSSTGMVFCDFFEAFHQGSPWTTRDYQGFWWFWPIPIASHTFLCDCTRCFLVRWQETSGPHVWMTFGDSVGDFRFGIRYTIVPVRRKFLCEASTGYVWWSPK